MVSGNSVGNLMNGGLAIPGEDWIYFANGNDENKLYKMRPNGQEVININDDAVSCLNLMGNFLYYHRIQDEGLYRIDINGQGRIRLVDEACWNIWVSDEKIYFTMLNNDNKLCQVSLDGSERKVYNLKNISGFNITDEYIYYLESCNGQGLEAINNQGTIGKLYRMDHQGESRELILEGVETFNLVEEWLYYVNSLDNYSLYKMQLGSTQQQKISSDVAAAINVAGPWVYYMNVTDNSKLYKIHIDGTRKTKLADAIPNNINVVTPWVFYEDVLNDYKICNIKG